MRWVMAAVVVLTGCSSSGGDLFDKGGSGGSELAELVATGGAGSATASGGAQDASGGATGGTVASGGALSTGGAAAESGGATAASGGTSPIDAGSTGGATATGGASTTDPDSGAAHPDGCLLYRHPCQPGHKYNQVQASVEDPLAGPDPAKLFAYYKAQAEQFCPEDRSQCLLRRDPVCPGAFVVTQPVGAMTALIGGLFDESFGGCAPSPDGCGSGSGVSEFWRGTNNPRLSITPTGNIGSPSQSCQCANPSPDGCLNANDDQNELYQPWDVPGFIP